MSLNHRRSPKGHPGIFEEVNTEIFKGRELVTTFIKDSLRPHVSLNGSALILQGKVGRGLFSQELNFKVFTEESSFTFQKRFVHHQGVPQDQRMSCGPPDSPPKTLSNIYAKGLMQAMHGGSCTWEREAGGFPEWEASLSYFMCSQPARATEWDY